VEFILGPRGTAAMYWPIVPVPGDCEDGEVGGMKFGWQGKPTYSEKTCPGANLSTTNPTCQTRARTLAAAVGSQRLTASAMARPTKVTKNSQCDGTAWNPDAHFGRFAVEIVLLNHINPITLTKFSSIPYKVSVQHSTEQYRIRSAHLQACVCKSEVVVQ
jgi:hypothetical protein